MEPFFYLVDSESGRPLARFPFVTLTRELEIISFEKWLRAKHHVDDPATGLDLRDSRLSPLPRNQWPPIDRSYFGKR